MNIEPKPMTPERLALLESKLLIFQPLPDELVIELLADRGWRVAEYDRLRAGRDAAIREFEAESKRAHANGYHTVALALGDVSRMLPKVMPDSTPIDTSDDPLSLGVAESILSHSVLLDLRWMGFQEVASVSVELEWKLGLDAKVTGERINSLEGQLAEQNFDRMLRLADQSMAECDEFSRPPSSLNTLIRERSQSLKLATENGRTIAAFTCDDCARAPICKLSFDHYNTNGDCLASK